ncbi:dihydroxyacetone kinase subunit DhaK [Vibrio sp. VB16]|uniref:dihydroxyacetone kinase subunit DhaK n=1 Tax=Vibrio sp. VB16 TaxID=2785746 RepID=UPI0018A1270F|nr:dihydroxyacetone kinase subunit DhaK [Vibrio sp. VB16]UGA57688.1 dihydroxyacetone kinase subunit DhaK [Vibrio sp. VB16]
MSKLFFNERKTLVSDAIDGLIYSNQHDNLTRLNIDEHIRVVIRKDWDKSKVALISGGGAGHEPAHAGFVGEGMLTAAVCGDVFASPSVEAVLNAILYVTGEAGCLLIVKNYTGDRLNFGLAAEKAKKLGYKVEMVIVNDDISIKDSKQPRGIAGTVFVHKVAGYYAQQDASLEDVRRHAESCNENVSSIGVAITSCHVPGEESEDRVPPHKAELGLGIHGEPGIAIIDIDHCNTVVEVLAEKLLEKTNNQKHALLLNNLGGTSPLEMSLLTKDVVESSLGKSMQYLFGPKPFVTAIDMKGFSLSCVVLTDDIEKALLAPVSVESWSHGMTVNECAPITIEKVSNSVEFTPSQSAGVESIVGQICDTIIELKSELNRLDALVGDGDTGSTFSSGALKVQQELNNKNLPLADVQKLLELVGEHLAMSMGGSSGILLSIFFTAAGTHFGKHQDLPEALLSGLEQMKFFGGAKVGDRTMIDALEPALLALRDENISSAVEAAKVGADSTAQMLEAKAGRSAYLNSESLRGVKDPGAVAVENVFAIFK